MLIVPRQHMSEDLHQYLRDTYSISVHNIVEITRHIAHILDDVSMCDMYHGNLQASSVFLSPIHQVVQFCFQIQLKGDTSQAKPLISD